MGDILAPAASLRYGRDLSEARAGPSGRLQSLQSFSSVLPHQLTLLAVPPGCESCSHSIPRLLLLSCLISLVLLGLQFLDGDTLEGILDWIKQDPVQGSLVFLAADIAAVTVMFPGAIFAMAGGAIFGVPYGCVLVWLGTSIGQTLAFIVGRYLLRGAVMGYLTTRFPKWAAVDSALSSQGWKLITLLRLSPVVPWNVLNYALSVTGVGLVPYALSSALAIIPWSITFVYFGSLAKNMADILEGKAGPNGGTYLALLAGSGVMLVAVVVYSTIVARKAIKEALVKNSSAADEELQSIVVASREQSEGGELQEASAKGGTAMADPSATVPGRRSNPTVDP